MDSQISAHSTSYAYTSNNYPHFYDAWVRHLFGTICRDTSTFLSHLPSTNPNPIIIDLCAGTGRVLKALAPHVSPQSKLYGIDHAPAMIARAQETFPARAQKPKWKVASATNFASVLEEGDRGAVDMLVFSAGSIGHLVEREEVRLFLAELKSVLKPSDGVAVVSVLTDCIPGKSSPQPAPVFEVPLNLPCKDGPQKGYWIKSPTTVTWNANKDVRTDTFSVEFYSTDGERVWREELKWSLAMFDEEAFKEDVEAAGLEIKELVSEGESFERFYVLKTKD